MGVWNRLKAFASPLQVMMCKCRNYSLLVFFFALAALYSILDVQRQQADKRNRRAVGEKRVNALGYYVVTLFHINLTVSHLLGLTHLVMPFTSNNLLEVNHHSKLC